MMKSKGWESSSVVSLTPGENENSRANLATYVERICFVHVCHVTSPPFTMWKALGSRYLGRSLHTNVNETEMRLKL
jgi:hypothetical protein